MRRAEETELFEEEIRARISEVGDALRKTQLTILNSMASSDFEESMRLHREWGLTWVDLRDEIYGKWVEELDLKTARQAKSYIAELGLQVYCVSTNVFVEEVANGEKAFRTHLDTLKRVVEICGDTFRPKLVRLNAADFAERSSDTSSIATIKENYPWFIDVYREAVDLLHDRGLVATIENEAFDCSLSKPQEFVEFFEWLDRSGVAGLTWDVQNQWSSGVFPSIEIYHQLKPFMKYYHVKGGRAGEGSDTLAWNVALQDASWPVVEITSAVAADGVSTGRACSAPPSGRRRLRGAHAGAGVDPAQPDRPPPHAP
jgi:sugar phosphate isomerase/epimerase